MTRPSDRAIAQAFREYIDLDGVTAQWANTERVFARAREIDAAAPDGAQAVAWRCFYCDETFTEHTAALEHFGPGDGYTRQSRTACQIDIAEYRRMEEKEARYAEEDAEVHRSMHRMASEHQQALQRAEESGYARGLRDSGQCPCAAPPSQVDEDAARLAAIGELVRTQDNRITDSPIFIVQQKRRIYGIDDGYCDNFVWIDGDDSYTDEEKTARDAERVDDNKKPAEYRQCGYIDIWEFVTACFTEQGCKDYLKLDGHNLREPRIYAAGSYRNEEWRFVRQHLIGLAARTARGGGHA